MSTQNIDTLKRKIDVSGWQSFSGQVNKEMRFNGEGKLWSENGSIYIGQYKDGLKTEGEIYELQSDDSITQFEVKYDENQ